MSIRVLGAREMVVRPNHLVVYAERDGAVTVLCMLHAAQQWPEQPNRALTPSPTGVMRAR